MDGKDTARRRRPWPPWGYGGPPWGPWPPMEWGPPPWAWGGYGPGPWGPPSLEEELEWLKHYAEMLKEEMEAVQRRIDELAAEAQT